MPGTPVTVDVEYFYQKGAKHPRKRGKSATNVNVQLSQVPRGTPSGVPYQVGFTLPAKLDGDTITHKLYIDLGSPLTWIDDKANPNKAFSDATNDVQIGYADDTVFRGKKETANIHYQTRTPITLQHLYAKGHLYDDINATTPIRTNEMRDGMLGLSPPANSKAYVKNLVVSGAALTTQTPTADIQTVLSALGADAKVGIFFTPHGISRQAQVSFKGFNQQKIVGDPKYAAAYQKNTGYWQMKQTMKYGTAKTTLSGANQCTTLIDTGYAFIDLPRTAYADYKTRTGAIEKNGHLVLNQTQFAALESLYFSVDGQEFEITKDAQLWPRKHNATEGFDAADYVLAIGDSTDAKMTYGLAWCKYFCIFCTGCSD